MINRFLRKESTRELIMPFKPYDPTNFENYVGQAALKRRLTLRLNSLTRGESLKALFFASFGQGKTSLARVIAREMFVRNLIDHYYETIAGRFETKSDVDRFLHAIKPYSLIFIDEIHGLSGTVRDALYPAIQDNIYAFQSKNSMLKLPPGLSWIGATTELGRVHPALQRRLIPMTLEPISVMERAIIAGLQEMPVDAEAAVEMANRCWSPWEIKDEIYATAKDVAKSYGADRINKKFVTESCDVLGIDSNSLRPHERRVLEALYKNPKFLRRGQVYAMSKSSLVALSGVDSETFIGAVEPKLLRLNYISVSSIGRELTPKSIEHYFLGE